MYDVSVPMALVDYIPVAFFAVAAVPLQRDLYNKMPNMPSPVLPPHRAGLREYQ